MRGYSETYKKDIQSTTKSIIQTYNTLGSESFGMEDIMNVFSLDLLDPSKRDDIKGAIFDQYKEYTEAVKQAEKDATKEFTKTTQMAHGRSTTDRYKAVDQSEFQPALKALNEQYKEAILTQSLLEAAEDNQLQDIATKLQEYSNVGRQISTMDLTYNRMKTRIESQIEKDLKGEGGLKVKTEILPAGSLAELEKQISDARKMLMDATTTEGRASADALIKHLESQKAVVEVLFKYSDPGNIGSGNKFATADPLAPLKGIGKVDMSNVVYSPELEMFDSWGERVGYVASQNRNLMDSIQGVSSIMASMGDVVGENAAQWMQWSANVLSAVGQGLPAIMALTEAKKAEATANTASAASGAASSVAGIPVAGPIMAVAAVASVLGALANLPKFAYGGIVGGSSFSGDTMLARVNSGEMILNSAQQNRLFQIANGAGSSGGRGELKLRVEGRDLVAALDSHNKWWGRI